MKNLFKNLKRKLSNKIDNMESTSEKIERLTEDLEKEIESDVEKYGEILFNEKKLKYNIEETKNKIKAMEEDIKKTKNEDEKTAKCEVLVQYDEHLASLKKYLKEIEAKKIEADKFIRDKKKELKSLENKKTVYSVRNELLNMKESFETPTISSNNSYKKNLKKIEERLNRGESHLEAREHFSDEDSYESKLDTSNTTSAVEKRLKGLCN